MQTNLQAMSYNVNKTCFLFKMYHALLVIIISFILKKLSCKAVRRKLNHAKGMDPDNGRRTSTPIMKMRHKNDTKITKRLPIKDIKVSSKYPDFNDANRKCWF